MFSMSPVVMWASSILLVLAIIHYVLRWYIFNVLQSEYADEDVRKLKKIFNIVKMSFYTLWIGIVLIVIYFKFH